MGPRVEIVDVSKAFSFRSVETPAISRLTLDVEPGEFVSLVGPSGCGKTTTLNIMAGLICPDSGQVLVNGIDYACKVYPKQGYLFQKDTLLPWLRVKDNIRLGLDYRHLSKASSTKRVADLLSLVGLQDFSNHYPYQLSIGMKRRINLLMILAPEPDILMLDEPFSAVDEPTRIDLHSGLLEMLKQSHRTTVLVTHDIAEAISLSDRVYVLTKRPARLSKVFTISLPRPRDLYNIRSSKQFTDLYGQIWETLGNEIRN